MNAIALDDERPALDVIETFCRRIDFVNLVSTFTRTSEARQYVEANEVDLLFLDINMPKETGLAFLKSMARQPLVIFTTAYSEFAVESYEVEAVDYLLKPFTFARFGQAVQRTQVRWQALSQPPGEPSDRVSDQVEPAYLYVRANYGLVKVRVADIRYVEGLDNYLKIHLEGSQSLVVRLTLKAMQDKLPTIGFLRVHRSYLVALDKITALRSRSVLIGEKEIPIGSRYETDVLGRFRP